MKKLLGIVVFGFLFISNVNTSFIKAEAADYLFKDNVYVDCDIIDEEIENKMQELFNKKTLVFHNAKFDLQWFVYHFNFKFPKF